MKGISESINEARELEYRVAFLLPGVESSDLESFKVFVPAKFAKAFEKFLEEEEGNTVFHASDYNGDFEI